MSRSTPTLDVLSKIKSSEKKIDKLKTNINTYVESINDEEIKESLKKCIDDFFRLLGEKDYKKAIKKNQKNWDKIIKILQEYSKKDFVGINDEPIKIVDCLKSSFEIKFNDIYFFQKKEDKWGKHYPEFCHFQGKMTSDKSKLGLKKHRTKKIVQNKEQTKPEKDGKSNNSEISIMKKLLQDSREVITKKYKDIEKQQESDGIFGKMIEIPIPKLIEIIKDNCYEAYKEYCNLNKDIEKGIEEKRQHFCKLVCNCFRIVSHFEDDEKFEKLLEEELLKKEKGLNINNLASDVTNERSENNLNSEKHHTEKIVQNKEQKEQEVLMKSNLSKTFSDSNNAVISTKWLDKVKENNTNSVNNHSSIKGGKFS